MRGIRAPIIRLVRFPLLCGQHNADVGFEEAATARHPPVQGKRPRADPAKARGRSEGLAPGASAGKIRVEARHRRAERRGERRGLSRGILGERVIADHGLQRTRPATSVPEATKAAMVPPAILFQVGSEGPPLIGPVK